MNKAKTIAILKGGLSAEYDISNKSAHSVKQALKAKIPKNDITTKQT